MNIGDELAGKFLTPVRRICPAGRLDVGGSLWQYSPPRFTGVDHYMPNQAPDLVGRTDSATVASLLWTM
ncbi:hypothetical protein ACFVHS_22045 [Streptomyces sp. NPDC057746]|uniref:hypothetical protein n=1 Tax=unclassified Streptomyces TaxID=2593676 RepID=UPI0033BEC8C3